MSIEFIRTKTALQTRVDMWQAAGDSVAVVPTMGALHAGHLSLVEAACADNERVIVTIFVNPTQFNNPSDLENYPGTEEEDARKLAVYPVDAVYAPDVIQLYPDGFATNVSVSGFTDVLCGAHRPGHFDGVATVVSKLFLQTRANRAYFGEKDYQQLQVVRRMAADLDIGIEVVGCPTVRDQDGLALSSRNVHLTQSGRTAAPHLQAEMQACATALFGGASMPDLTDGIADRLHAAGFDKVEYFELRRADNLGRLDRVDAPARLFAAAWIDGIRLIDNIPVVKDC